MLSKLFRQMATAAQAFSAGDENVRFDERRGDEFSALLPPCSAGQAVRIAENIQIYAR